MVLAKIRKLIDTKLTSVPDVLSKQYKERMFEIAFGMLKAGSPLYQKIANCMGGEAKPESRQQNVYNFFHHAKVDVSTVLIIVLALTDQGGNLSFAIDRTHWERNGVIHNYLIISLIVYRTSIPVAVLSLQKKGNAGDAACKELLKKLLAALPAGRNVRLAGDAEFIGKTLRQFTDKKGVSFLARLRKNQVFVIEGRRTTVEELFVDEGREVWGLDDAGNKVFIKTYFVKGQWVAVAATHESRNARQHYADRWMIEVGFQALKKRGLNIEDTGLKDPEKLEKLILVAGLALTLAVVAARIERLRGRKDRKNDKGQHRESEVKLGMKAIWHWSGLSTYEPLEFFFRYLNLLIIHFTSQVDMYK